MKELIKKISDLNLNIDSNSIVNVAKLWLSERVISMILGYGITLFLIYNIHNLLFSLINACVDGTISCS